MARILDLALKISADGGGVPARLTPVERALKSLEDQSAKVSKVFEQFAGTSDAAARAQAQTAESLRALREQLASGAITAQQFAERFNELSDAANAQAESFQRAAEITEQNISPIQRYERSFAELTQLLREGKISQETYNSAVEKARRAYDSATGGASNFEKAVAGQTLKFNELSGIFAALPGPLGNIAGRFSGLASAGEGLSRIFSGGLQQGLTGIASSVTALINPFTLAVAGIAAFGAAATAVARGLLELDDRVEKLGNTADKLGVSFGFIQTLDESARRSGTSIEAVSAAFGRLQKSVLGVDEESKAAQKALAEIGVTAEELQSLSPEEQYQRIGTALASIEDPARRTAAATALFGRAGADLIPFFNNLPGAADDIERFGRVLSDLDRSRIDAFGAAVDKLAVSSQGLGQSLLVPFAGLGDGITTALAEITSGITAIVDPIGRVLEPVLTNIGRVIELLGVSLGSVGRTIGAVFEPFAAIVQEISAALEPLYEGIFNFLQSISNAAVSTTEWIVSFSPIGVIAENIGALGETVGRVVTIITTAFQRVGEFVSGLASRFGELVAQSPFLETLGNVISSVFGSVASVFSTIANAIGGFVGRLLTIAENFLGIDRSAQQATEATAGLGSEIVELTEEERKQASEREKFLQGFTDNVSKAIDESAKFGKAGFDAALQYQTAIDELQRQFDAGILNETSFRQEAEKASAAYTAQIDVIKQAAAETEAITQRVDGLLAKANELPQAQQDLNAVEAEIARVEAALVAARAAGQSEQADALAGRLAQLDQLQAGLEQKSDEAAQGFAQGFDAAFANVDSGINSLIDKASEFGNEGAIAASQLQEGIAAAQEQVRDGILNREAFESEVARQKQLFQDRVDDLRQAEKIGQDIAAKQEQLRAREFEIQLGREEELASVRTGAIQVQDIRSGGISAFFDALEEDPALGEARKQTRELQGLRKDIVRLQGEKAEILEGAL